MAGSEFKEVVIGAPAVQKAPTRSRWRERIALLLATLLVAAGLWRVIGAMETDLAEAQAGLDNGTLLELSSMEAGNLAALDSALAEGRFLTDPADRALATRTVSEHIAEGNGFPNVGTLNTRAMRVAATTIDSVGGEVYRQRLATSREENGLTPELRAAYASGDLPPLPSTSGEGEVSIDGFVENEDGEPLANVTIALAKVPPFFPDSLYAIAAQIDTVDAGVRGQAIIGTTEAGEEIRYAFVDTVRTDAAGQFSWSGLDEDAGYTVRAMLPGFTFGPRQGVDHLGEAGLFRDFPRPDFGVPTFSFVGKPHRITLFSRFTYDRLKRNGLVARSPEAFMASLIRILALFFVPFWFVHLLWSARRFQGDQVMLPLSMLITGVSMMLMISLPDPLRDRYLSDNMVGGISVGVVLLGIIALLDVSSLRESLWRRVKRVIPARARGLGYRMWMPGYVWVVVAFALMVLVLLIGTGPEGSGAKVNLFGVQPSEVVKLLMVLFFASYLAEHGELLRKLTFRRRKYYAVGIGVGISIVLGMYGLQGDLGPALVVTLTLLVMWGLVRGKWLPVTLGAGLIVGGYTIGSTIVPRVANRTSMWLSPWDNNAYGGDHLAHALWTLATGGIPGRGLGRGSAYAMPEAHTDMILPSIGEEIGLAGMLVLLTLVGVLLHRGSIIALRAAKPFATFLGLGLVAATSIQFLLIASGSLGLLPLTGVSVPLLSYGKATTVVSFITIGLLVSLSARRGDAEQREAVRKAYAMPVGIGVILLGLGITAIGSRIGYVQGVLADDILVKPALVAQRSGLRAYSYNPRISQVRDAIPAGTIFDRNGVPLATSNMVVLDTTASQLADLGVTPEALEALRNPRLRRAYPMGDLMVYLVGDLNTRLKWGSELLYSAEFTHLDELRGFDNTDGDGARQMVSARIETPFRPGGEADTSYTARRYSYEALKPLVRAGVDSPEMEAFAARDRDIWLTIDARMQQRMLEVLTQRSEADPRIRGKRISAVAMDAASGDLLASVNLPVPNAMDEPASVETDPQAYDRAMFARLAPGSTAKVATAMAAFNKLGLAAADWTTVVTVGANRADPQDPVFPLRPGEPTGTVGMRNAIVRSSNAYFRQISTDQNLLDEMLEIYDAFGFTVGFSDWTEAQKRTSLGHAFELRWAAMGQGLLTGAPYNLAQLAGTIARGGDLRDTRFVWKASGEVRPPHAARPFMDPQAAELLGSYMAGVSGSRATPLTSIGVSGKTGTASVADKPNNGWYFGFKPWAGPTGGDAGASGESALVIAVLVEEGRASSRAAELSYHLFNEFL